MRRYRLCRFPGLTTTVPSESLDVTWSDLVRELAVEVGASKEGSMFSFHVLDAGAPVQNQFIRGLDALTFDFDGDKEPAYHLRLSEAFSDVLTPLASAGLQTLLYATHSNRATDMADLCRVRVVLPLSRTVTIAEYERLWDLFQQTFRGKIDPQTRKAAQRYYAPRRPEDVPEIFVPLEHGEPLNVEEALARAPTTSTGPAKQAGTLSRTPTREDLKKLGAALVRSPSAERAVLGEAFRKLAKGEPYADKGHREATTFRLCSELAKKHPKLDPAKTAELFAPSLALMQPTKVTLNEVAAKLTRAVEHQATKEREGRATRVAKAFGERNRSDGYTHEELAALCEFCDAETPAEIVWICQRGEHYWLLTPAGYRQFGRAEIESAVRVYLAPAVDHGVEIDVLTPQGMKPRPTRDLVVDYGVVLNAVEFDLSAQVTVYNRERNTLTLSTCPYRHIEPRFDPQIDRWLQHLGGDKYPALAKWLVSLTRIERPALLLFIEGLPNSGKSLFIQGCARLWTVDGATDLEEAMGPWNTRIRSCPLVAGDEVIPRDSRGRTRTEELRQLVQQRSMPLREKYAPNATIRGSIRLVIVANNRDLLSSGGNLTGDDIAAVSDRILHVPVTDKRVQHYLAGLPAETKRAWVEDDLIAAHVLALAKTITLDEHARFLVENDSAALVRSMATSTGVQSLACHWLTGWLLDPEKFSRAHVDLSAFVRVREGRLWVNVQALHRGWESYIEEERVPRVSVISKALNSICGPREEERLFRAAKRPVRFRPVLVEYLAHWATENGVASEQDLLDRIVALDEDNANGQNP